MAIETVSFPIKNGGSFHSYVNVYQRVTTTFTAYFTAYFTPDFFLHFCEACFGLCDQAQLKAFAKAYRSKQDIASWVLRKGPRDPSNENLGMDCSPEWWLSIPHGIKPTIWVIMLLNMGNFMVLGIFSRHQKCITFWLFWQSNMTMANPQCIEQFINEFPITTLIFHCPVALQESVWRRTNSPVVYKHLLTFDW